MRILGVVALVALSGACVSGGADVSDPVPTLFEDPVPEIDTEPSEPASSTSSSSTVPISERLPLLAQEFPGAVVTADGVLLPITGTDGDVWFVLGPCGEERIEPSGSAMLATAQHVVLDPGGNDDGAARTNLAVAQRTAELLEAEGVVVALTRLGPAELAAETRGAAVRLLVRSPSCRFTAARSTPAGPTRRFLPCFTGPTMAPAADSQD